MIEANEWEDMKKQEVYGMIARLERRIDALNKKIDEHKEMSEFCPHTLR